MIYSLNDPKTAHADAKRFPTGTSQVRCSRTSKGDFMQRPQKSQFLEEPSSSMPHVEVGPHHVMNIIVKGLHVPNSHFGTLVKQHERIFNVLQADVFD